MTTLWAMALITTGCTGFKGTNALIDSSSSSSIVGGPGGSTTPPVASSVVAGSGANVAGTGALSIGTTEGLVARVTNGLQGNVSPLAGNYAKSLLQVRSNLPKVADPTKATGFDQAQLLIYAACSDLTTGTTPLMQSKYKIVPASSIATNQPALIAAGVLMLDQYTASLASQGPTSAQVTAAFTTLLTQVSATAANTSTIAFMSVCIAANSAGSTLMGF